MPQMAPIMWLPLFLLIILLLLVMKSNIYFISVKKTAKVATASPCFRTNWLW